MKKVLFAAVLVAVTFLSGCASVPMESKENTALAKQFNTPSEGNSGLYVYRSGSFGGALKKDVWVDGDCLGETAPDMFFYKEVKGDEQHKIATESEFSPNDLLLDTETGKNYFIRQYMKIGVFVGGAGVELVDEEKGKKDISSLNMAKIGTCSK
ncbi:MAG TPA: DUF2846 domain-containing protein [Methylophaga aminisulfidivorans]|uniref:DUF2846 domain-containing protein n=1 Tax=Methylophaga TaxID=40222 RepID=UPI001A1346F0|nr:MULTISPECIES: DUF2846 domain-containing protein [Methylophaga]HIM40808.1 DUF2846 domain-containing protein [Methylophaga aminisulfidivorans]